LIGAVSRQRAEGCTELLRLVFSDLSDRTDVAMRTVLAGRLRVPPTACQVKRPEGVTGSE